MEPVSIEDLYYKSLDLPQIKRQSIKEQRQYELAIAQGGRYPGFPCHLGIPRFIRRKP